MNCCRPSNHSHFLVLGAIKGVCAGEKGGDAGGHRFYPVPLILCSYEGWSRRQLALFCIRMCLEIQKRGLAFTAYLEKVTVFSAEARKGVLRTMCKWKGAGPKVPRLAQGSRKTCPEPERRVAGYLLSVLGVQFSILPSLVSGNKWTVISWNS